jgi:omega-amidase
VALDRRNVESESAEAGSFRSSVREAAATSGTENYLSVLLCQFDLAWEDRQANLAKARAIISAAAPPPGSLIVLPEMFPTGFSMNKAATIEEAGGETESCFRELAAQTRSCVLGGLVAVSEGAPRNQAVAVAPTGEVLARYSKQRTFSLAGEGAHYLAGDRTAVFDWGGFRIAPLVCYDLRFPELFRAGAAHGATLFAVIANWPVAREAHWVTLLEARAIENQAFVIGVNRSGDDPHFHYPGRSLVVDPHGSILADAGDCERVVTASICPDVVTDWRLRFPALRDAHLV